MALVNNATARGIKQSTIDATFGNAKGAVNPATGVFEYTSVSHVFGFWELNEDFYLTDKNREIDPVGQEWERQVLCDTFGVQSRDGRQDCREDPGRPKGVGFAFFFKRSLGDEFGRAIVGDLGELLVMTCGGGESALTGTESFNCVLLITTFHYSERMIHVAMLSSEITKKPFSLSTVSLSSVSPVKSNKSVSANWEGAIFFIAAKIESSLPGCCFSHPCNISLIT